MQTLANNNLASFTGVIVRNITKEVILADWLSSWMELQETLVCSLWYFKPRKVTYDYISSSYSFLHPQYCSLTDEKHIYLTQSSHHMRLEEEELS